MIKYTRGNGKKWLLLLGTSPASSFSLAYYCENKKKKMRYDILSLSHWKKELILIAIA